VDVIGVIDLRGGRAVHARGGVRHLYAPVRVPPEDGDGPRYGVDGDAIALARFYAEELGIEELYVADLDAIALRRPQYASIDALVALGMPIWLDAGIADAREARAMARRGSSRIVVGSETLRSMASLGELALAVGGERVAFSLDLRSGCVIAPDGKGADPPETIAARVADAGIRALIVLDLARVGTGSGLDIGLLSRIRAAAPGVALLAGGGIAGPDDLRSAEEAGCDGVLVASALLDGRLAAADVRHAMSRR